VLETIHICVKVGEAEEFEGGRREGMRADQFVELLCA
jgi:hypothetical protein